MADLNQQQAGNIQQEEDAAQPVAEERSVFHYYMKKGDGSRGITEYYCMGCDALVRVRGESVANLIKHLERVHNTTVGASSSSGARDATANKAERKKRTATTASANNRGRGRAQKLVANLPHGSNAAAAPTDQRPPDDECNKEFVTDVGMHYHWRRCGRQESDWKCNICGLVLRRGPKTMLRHLQQNHKDVVAQGSFDPSLLNSEDIPPKTEKVKMPQTRKVNSPRGEGGLDPYIPAFLWTLELQKKHFKDVVFPDWASSRRLFLRLSQNEYCPYIPHTRESVSFMVKKSESANESPPSWKRLKLFETHPPEGDPFHQTFFVGGPVWASAWCPTPLNTVARQYIAIASCLSMDVVHPMTDTDSERGLLQFWDIGFPNVAGFTSNPCITLAIAHGYGVIWDMEWCHAGGWQDPEKTVTSSEDFMPRLGLLALACGDGNVRILSIPHPEYLHDGIEPLPVYRTQPVAVLEAPGTGPAFANQVTACGCVSWVRTGEKQLIAAGYRNGLVSIWDLKSRTPLLVVAENKNQVILRPFMTFQAHGASITGIAWSPTSNGRFLATGSFDRSVKIWDLEDCSIPICISKKGLITDISWCSHWNGVFAAADECYNISHTHTFYKECGYYNFHTRVLSAHNSCIWTIDVSDWLNSEASGDEAGEVVVTVLCQLMKNVDTIKQMSHRRMPVYRVEWQPLNPEQSLPRKEVENVTSAPSKAKQRKSSAPKKNVKKIFDVLPAMLDVKMTGENSMNLQPQTVSSGGVMDNGAPSCELGMASTSVNNNAGVAGRSGSLGLGEMSHKTYQRVSEAYGLVFVDAPVHNVKNIPQEDLKRLVKPDTMNYHLPNNYPLTSVSCVKWNPNLGSHLWLFSVGQAGIARVSCLSGLHRKEVEGMIVKQI